MQKTPLIAATLVVVSMTALVITPDSPPASDGSTRRDPGSHGHPVDGLPVRNFGRPLVAPADRTNPIASALALPPGFPSSLDPSGFTLPLPGGGETRGRIEQHVTDPVGGLVMIEGSLSAPADGRFLFQRQPEGALPGPLFGFLYFPGEPFAYKVETTAGGRSVLVRRPAGAVACVGYASPVSDGPVEIPADHPVNMPIPDYQNGVVPLQSLPGATGVIYLDFDGEEGPHSGWGDFDAAAFNSSNSQIRSVWERVAEDYAPFNLNVTTDLQVYLDAPETSRQRCIVTPTTDAFPGAGGVAYIGSFNSGGDTPCWAFYGSGKASAEVISHEVGHTLGLGHDGRTTPSEEYYGGHGTGDTGWAPIMGLGYYKNLTQWSLGEYLNANRTQDDLAEITTGNNLVDFRIDDHGDDHATASRLDFGAGGDISDEGIIEENADVDAFLFTTSTGGSLNLSIDPVAVGPNLDILAEIYDAAGTLLDTHNPDLELDATLTTNVPAGTYTVRVTNTGRGDPLDNGYTGYSTLGAYTISGSIPGVVLPDQFEIAEHSPDLTPVGTVTARTAHGAATLTWSIESGNSLGLFAINPATGEITIANSSLLDLEALSAGWNDPAIFDLTVTIHDSLDPFLDEAIRALVTVIDVNEAPSLAGLSVLMLEHTRIGRPLTTVTGTDPDRLDGLTYAITAGDPDGHFAITTGGVLSPAADLDASAQALYKLTVTASDSGEPALTGSATVTINLVDTDEGYTPGGLFHTFYRDIDGTRISDLTASPVFPLEPDDEDLRDEVHAIGDGDNYGRTARGYLLPPHTGDYTLSIAGDDGCELLLSSDHDPANATTIAAFSGSTSYQQWTKYGGQQSAVIPLIAGTAYYFEARQKEGGGGDHLSLAWKIDATGGGSPIVPLEPIPGLFLAPHHLNYRPAVVSRTATQRANAYGGAPVATMSATDINTADTHSFAITGGNPSGAFAIDASSGLVRVADTSAFAATGTHTLTITATDSGQPALDSTGTLTVHVAAADAITATGPLLEIWDNLSGSTLADLTDSPLFPDRPDRLIPLDGLDSGQNIGGNYGARIRAILTSDTGSDYVFHIASNDQGALLVSTDTSPDEAAEIATVPGATSYKEWDKYPASQASSAIPLAGGQSYFIEGRVKEGGGSDHLAIGWSSSAITSVELVDPARLAPYDSNVAPDLDPVSPVIDLPAAPGVGTVITTFSAFDSPFEEITFALLSGDSGGAFVIDPGTGLLTVANPAVLGPGPHTLEVAAQDSGHGGYFPLRHSTTTATVYLGDSDHDHLPDAWELEHFGDLASDGAGDNDLDGESNYTAYLFRSDPVDPDSFPAAPRANGVSRSGPGGGTTTQFAFTIRRNLPAGAYVLERSIDLSAWTAIPAGDLELLSVTPVDTEFETHLIEVTVPGDTVFLRAATTSP